MIPHITKSVHWYGFRLRCYRFESLLILYFRLLSLENWFLPQAHFKVSHPEWFEEIEAKPSTAILVVDLEEYKRAAQREIDSGGASMHFKPKHMAKIEIRLVFASLFNLFRKFY